MSQYDRKIPNIGGLSWTNRQAIDVLSVLSSHVESIVKLVRKPDSYVKLSLDVEDYYRIKDTEGNKKIE